MRIEHTGYMVEDPPRVAAWYVQHLGFRVARQLPARPFTTFLVDASGQGMVEIYNNPAAQVPDYRSLDPLILHLAFDVANEPILAARDRLLAAGATIASDVVTTASGDRLVMLRDPWGFAVQLVERKEALR
jgi:catechol 2,3-dioxygenase-like lactoylglutathione lyase family enzyme